MDEPGVIAGGYVLDRAQPAAVLVGGLRAYVASSPRDTGRPLLAIQVRPDLPPRARLLVGMAAEPAHHLTMPLEHGPGRDLSGRPSFYVLCPALPGPALTAAQGPWGESEVMSCLFAPSVTALETLAERSVTHRAIRPDNIFRAGRRERVVLGPHWASPPGSLQPPAFEPPYSAMCLPSGRGDGTIADDVYALGATMLWCLHGVADPWPDAAAVLRHKLEVGSFAALTGTLRLSASMADLLRVMLAEDPDHRPTPEILRDPTQAGLRRLAARPPQRAQRPLEIGGIAAWNTRELAFAIARHPEPGAAMVKAGAVDRWLRRMLGDSQLAVTLDETVQRRGLEAEAEDKRSLPLLALRTVAVLDPLAPMTWRGFALFPDGLGAALIAAVAGADQPARRSDQQAASQPDAGPHGRPWCSGPADANDGGPLASALHEIAANDCAMQWAVCHKRRHGLSGLDQEMREWRRMLGASGAQGGLRRLIYGLNPLLVCASPLLAGHVAARLADLVPALEAAATAATTDRKRPPIDGHLVAFVAARADAGLLGDITSVKAAPTEAERLAVLNLFSRMQTRLHHAPMPGLAGWLQESGQIDVSGWQNLRTRERIAARIAAHAAAGEITPIVALLEDNAALGVDALGAAKAANRIAVIKAELAALHGGGARREATARRIGRDVAAATGMVAAIGAAVLLTLAG